MIICFQLTIIIIDKFILQFQIVSSLFGKSHHCTSLLHGVQSEINFAEEYLKWNWQSSADNYWLHNTTASCDWIKSELSNNYYVSNKEINFPLAFILSVYSSPYQIFRFLKVIYRPHNVYCIHYDQKSDDSFKRLMMQIAECLPNVIIPSKIVDVVWGWHTIIDAQLNCMESLYAIRQEYPWRYAITLCGKEVPLRTNREIVESLEKLNGMSAVKAHRNGEDEHFFWKYKHIFNEGKVQETSKLLGPVPYGLEIVKSLSYYGLSDRFVDYLLHDPVAVNFKEFMDQTHIPDEHYVATLFNKKGIVLTAIYIMP